MTTRSLPRGTASLRAESGWILHPVRKLWHRDLPACFPDSGSTAFQHLSLLVLELPSAALAPSREGGSRAQVFNWSADRDHEPCPFGATYQLARNALAATITTDGSLKADRGHVLVLYDVRNPAFLGGGRAARQWQLVGDASLHQGLFRQLNWQSLLASLVNAVELAYLVDGFGEKYGLEPD